MPGPGGGANQGAGIGGNVSGYVPTGNVFKDVAGYIGDWIRPDNTQANQSANFNIDDIRRLQEDNNAAAMMMALQQQEASQSSAREAMKFSADQSQLDRDWQERMSNTAYQRAVADMKAAGINPALAYSQGGATTPGGSAATGSTAAMSEASVDNDTIKAILAEYMQNQTAVQVASINSVARVLGSLRW